MNRKATNDIIKNWFDRATGKTIEFSIFDKFISLWISFNAWGAHTTQTNKDRDMIENLKENVILKDTYIKLLNENSDFKACVKALMEECPVYDDRFIDSREYYENAKHFNDLNNFDQLLEIIYQVRCNLFHGRKNIDEKRDQKLVELCFKILHDLFCSIPKKV
jgi:hypothetical protein